MLAISGGGENLQAHSYFFSPTRLRVFRSLSTVHCSFIADRSTIFFDSHNVSKSDSSSQLSVLDPDDQDHVPQIDVEKLAVIVKVLREELNLTLFGIDIVVENGTGRHAIIDINVYPGNYFISVQRLVEPKARTQTWGV